MLKKILGDKIYQSDNKLCSAAVFNFPRHPSSTTSQVLTDEELITSVHLHFFGFQRISCSCANKLLCTVSSGVSHCNHSRLWYKSCDLSRWLACDHVCFGCYCSRWNKGLHLWRVRWGSVGKIHLLQSMERSHEEAKRRWREWKVALWDSGVKLTREDDRNISAKPGCLLQTTCELWSVSRPPRLVCNKHMCTKNFVCLHLWIDVGHTEPLITSASTNAGSSFFWLELCVCGRFCVARSNMMFFLRV